MLSLILDHLEPAGAAFAGVLAVRTLPFVLLSLVTRSIGLLHRIALPAAYVGLMVSVAPATQAALAWLLVAVCYYAVVASGVYCLGTTTRALTRSDAAALFLGLTAMLLVVPGAALPVKLVPTFVFIGWELLLKSYSYVLEAQDRVGATLRSCMFFLLVDPTIVFVHRARRESLRPPILSSAGRILLGTSSMVLCFGALQPITQVLSATLAERSAPGAAAGYGVARFLATYAAHSGVASIEIGFMRLYGYSVGERYRYPFLASSPADFWSRWNIYIYDWVKRYMYLPLALRLRRSRSLVVRRYATFLGVLASFLGIGLLHDAHTGIASREWTLSVTCFFLLSALLFVLWNAVATLGRLRIAQSRVWRRLRPGFGRVLQRFGFASALLVLVVLWR